MFLLIFESIGTSELILIGIVALIFLGPRKLPEIAKKIGKITAEFRSTANEFKETWRREVDLEDETKALDLNAIEAEVNTVPRGIPEALPIAANVDVESPSVREVDPAAIEQIKERSRNVSEFDVEDSESDRTDEGVSSTQHEDGDSRSVTDGDNDKRNWL